MHWVEGLIECIGEDVHSLVLDAVDRGQISLKHAKNIASKLHPNVYGRFMESSKQNNFKFDRSAFNEMLCDWYEIDDDENVTAYKLKSAFEHLDVNIKPIVKKMKELELAKDLKR